ncbi:MAG: NAD(P)H-dependent oxidoreductase [Verrucomicrobiota bacterium]
MDSISTTRLLEALQWRYATKVFDPSKTIPDETWTALEDSLVLTPSSFGLQPWQFLVITNSSIKESLLEHSWGQKQVVDCSHLVVFAVLRSVDEQAIDKFLDVSAASRGIDVSELDGYRNVVIGFAKNMSDEQKKDWAIRQAYIALGQFMLSASLLGVDACPMEGFIPAKYDEVLGLEAKGLTAGVVCPVGYRDTSDKYASYPKARFEKGDVVQHLS